MSGLKINFHKSTLIPIYCDEGRVEEARDIIHCLVLQLLIKYLGIPLGANLRHERPWVPLLGKVAKKLSSWKSIVLSRAGRLVLIKSVHNSLPLYYMGLSKVPKKVLEKLVGIQRRFLWAGSDGRRGIPLVR